MDTVFCKYVFHGHEEYAFIFVLVGLDSMTWWIIEKLVGFTDIGLLRISERVRAYAFQF